MINKFKKNVLVPVIYRKVKKMDLSLDNGFYIGNMRRALKSLSTFYEH